MWWEGPSKVYCSSCRKQIPAKKAGALPSDVDKARCGRCRRREQRQANPGRIKVKKRGR